MTEDGRVLVDLGPVYDSVILTLDQEGLVDAAAAPSVAVSVPLIRASDLDRAQTVYNLLDAAGFWLPALWLVLVVLTLLVATERRRAAVWLARGLDRRPAPPGRGPADRPRRCWSTSWGRTATTS